MDQQFHMKKRFDQAGALRGKSCEHRKCVAGDIRWCLRCLDCPGEGSRGVIHAGLVAAFGGTDFVFQAQVQMPTPKHAHE
jgi:hypothetical protein